MGFSSETGKRLFSVAASSVGAAPIALGAVYATERFLPHQMAGIKKLVAEHIVTPNLDRFEKLSFGLRKAHETYAEKKREAVLQSGGTPEAPNLPPDPQERAYMIADALVRSAVALATDFVATFGLQVVLNKTLGVPKGHPGKVAFIESTATLLGIVAMPTLLAKTAENIRYGLARKLQSFMGKDKQSADNIALPFTYVTLPNLAAAGLAVGASHYLSRK